MSVEKKTVRSDIPGSHVFLNGNIGYVGSTADDARRLVVGRDISLQGQIGACTYLVIEGVVESEAFTGRRMDILDQGLFSGTAVLHDCVIAGRFEGKLSVTGRLTVKSTGQIRGEIEYGVLEVEAGAKIEGHMYAVPPAPVEVPLVETANNNNVEKLFSDEEEVSVETERATSYRRTARA